MQDKTDSPVKRYKIGTCYFRDMVAACYHYEPYYFNDDVQEKFKTLYNFVNSKVTSGEIKIGPPPQPKNSSDLIELDAHGRYWISCVWKN